MLGFYDYARGLAFVGAAIVLAMRDIETWMIADCVLSIIHGAALIFLPTIIFDRETDGIKADPLHVYFLRLMGCTFIASAVVLYSMWNSKDRNAIKTLQWSRTVSIGLVTCRIIYDRLMHPKVFTDFHMWYAMCLGVVWLVVQCVHLYRCGMEAPHKGLKNPVNKFYQIDTIFHAIGVVPDLFCPFVILLISSIKTDLLHNHYFAVFGGLNIGTCVLTWLAPTFRFDEDKRAVFCSRLTSELLTLFCFVYGTTKEGLFGEWYDYIFASAGFPIVIGLNLAGLYTLHNHRSSLQSNYNLRTRN